MECSAGAGTPDLNGRAARGSSLFRIGRSLSSKRDPIGCAGSASIDCDHFKIGSQVENCQFDARAGCKDCLSRSSGGDGLRGSCYRDSRIGSCYESAAGIHKNRNSVACDWGRLADDDRACIHCFRGLVGFSGTAVADPGNGLFIDEFKGSKLVLFAFDFLKFIFQVVHAYLIHGSGFIELAILPKSHAASKGLDGLRNDIGHGIPIGETRCGISLGPGGELYADCGRRA